MLLYGEYRDIFSLYSWLRYDASENVVKCSAISVTGLVAVHNLNRKNSEGMSRLGNE